MWYEPDPTKLTDSFENYVNRGWIFYYLLQEAANLCRDKEYIKARYHPDERKVNVTIGKNDTIEEGVALLKV